jgi:anthranilate phosphoribosyltransferase
VHPSDFGIPKADRKDLQGGDAATNAAILREILSGETGPRRDVVLLNAGASLFVGGAASSVREGIERAAAAIDSGAARTKLDAMIQASHGQHARPAKTIEAAAASRPGA